MPSISISSEKLSTIRITTISASTPTLSIVGSTMIVRTMSPMMSTSRPSRIERPMVRRTRGYAAARRAGSRASSAKVTSAVAPPSTMIAAPTVSTTSTTSSMKPS